VEVCNIVKRGAQSSQMLSKVCGVERGLSVTKVLGEAAAEIINKYQFLTLINIEH
jgi:hypothetical protein